jgi:hypothetical protein
MSGGPTPDDLRAKVFEDRKAPGDWRIEKFDEDGACELARLIHDGGTKRVLMSEDRRRRRSSSARRGPLVGPKGSGVGSSD